MQIKLIINDKASSALKTLKAKLTDRTDLNSALAKSGEVQLRRHFLALNKKPNKRGWKKQNYWSRVRKSTSIGDVSSTKAEILVSESSFAIKVHGGTIRPTGNRKYLAIPARESRYGISPRSADDRDDLFFRKTKSISYLAKKDGKAYRVQYWLVRKVEQKPDPNALPDENDILTQAKKTIKRYLLK